jgi:heptosyltransferase III
VKTSIDLSGKRIVISRTDSIGDVMLTLPMVAWLKTAYPTCHITFLCRNYTAPIVQCYEGIDAVLRLESIEELPLPARVSFIAQHAFEAVIHVFPRKELAALFKKAKVPSRVGTSHRGYHILTCNIRPNFSRKRSGFHESQLNFELLKPFGVEELPSFEQLNAWTEHLTIPEAALPAEIQSALDGSEKAVVLHPKSQGSAREWPIGNYMELAKKLAQENRTVLFTGTEKEGLLFRDLIPEHPLIINTTGKLNIEQLLFLLKQVDALVACSTGPLHLAGFMGKRAIGLFSPKIPIHPGRWRALGKRSVAVVYDENCPTCKAKKPCDCIEKIPVSTVLDHLNN